MDDNELFDDLLESNESEKEKFIDYYYQQFSCKKELSLCRMGTKYKHSKCCVEPNVNGEIVKLELFDLRLSPPDKTVSMFCVDCDSNRRELNDNFLCLISQYVKDDFNKPLPCNIIGKYKATVLLDREKFNKTMSLSKDNEELFKSHVKFTETLNSRGGRGNFKKCKGKKCNPKHRGRHWDLEYFGNYQSEDLIIIKRMLCDMMTVL